MRRTNREMETGGGIGLFGLLFVAFVILKLCNVISWSWWWITAPLWGPFILGVLFWVVLLIAGIIMNSVERKKLSNKNQSNKKSY